MTNPYFPKLFQPIVLAEGLELKNRIVMAPMATNFADEQGAPTENQCNYYRLRARKNVALIVSESNYVRADGKNAPTRMGLHSDHVIPAHKRLTTAVHEEGAKVCAQLHYGGFTIGTQVVGRYPISCSATPLDTKGEVGVGLFPRKMNVRDIKALVDCYAAAAARACEAGYDAIQIHCAHGYLLNQFLSPRINKRTDEYGGSEEKRLRFMLEIFEAIRNTIGYDFPMTVRFSGEEPLDGGYDYEFIIKAINELKRYKICEVSISGGSYEEGAHKIAPPYWYKPGYYADVARKIRERIDIPVSTVGRITTPRTAETLLARGDADLVYIGRELVAFPFFGEAAEKGKPVKECLGCNCCFDSMAKGDGLRCMINPFAGDDAAILEAENSDAGKTKKPKNITVIGAGPAGLTAAVEAARLGHKATLFEKERILGGKLNVAGKMVKGKDVIKRLATYLEGEARDAGVEIVTGRKIENARDLNNPDVVIVATGARERELVIDGLRDGLLAEDAIKNPARIGQRVVIIGGGLAGSELAEGLAVMGKEVSIVEMLPDILQGYEFPNKRPLMHKLCDLGVWIYVSSKVLSADGESLKVQFKQHTFDLPYDTVIMATGYVNELSLKENLEKEGVRVAAIGDCLKPGKIINAIRAAVDIVQSLEQ